MTLRAEISLYGISEAKFPKLRQQAIRYKSFVLVALLSNIGYEDYISDIAAQVPYFYFLADISQFQVLNFLS